MGKNPAAVGPSPASDSAPWLEISDRHGRPVRRVELHDAPIVVGRSPSAQVRLEHETISRQHAVFYCDPFGRWWVRDLGSRNGIKINHRKVAESVIAAGDLVRLGDFHFVLRHPLPATIDPPTEPCPPLTETPDAELTTVDTTRSPQIAANHLMTIMELGSRLRQLSDPAERAKEICALMVSDEFRGRAALLLHLDRSAPDRPTVLCHSDCAGASTANRFHISRTLLRKVAQTGAATVASNIPTAGSDIEISIPPDLMPISAAACPLEIDERKMNLLYVVFPPECARPEWLALTSLVAAQWMQSESIWATQRDIAAHAAIESDLRRARTIQQQLVPRDLSIAGLDIAISFDPSRWVGGDYVDVAAVPPHKVLLAVADVCGKGLQAALLASSIHTMVHAALRTELNLAGLVGGLNDYLCAYAPGGSFVTMFAAVLDLHSGQLQYINAGHPPGLIFTSGNSVRRLAATSAPLCLDSEPAAVQTEQLQPGEMLALFTDGWTDLPGASGSVMEAAEFDQLIHSAWRQSIDAPAAQFVQRVTQSLSQYLKDTSAADDRTFLAVRRK